MRVRGLHLYEGPLEVKNASEKKSVLTRAAD
jgi:hypothetical protein